jgi:predicted dithiol-disulfide oxidoreductase (DUF899 family)
MTMSLPLPRISGPDEWLAARTELLAKEKDLTRRRDAIAAERRNLPMVEVEKDYVFEGPDGPARLIDVFEGRPQLVVYHFMFHPDWDEGCPNCTAGTDEMVPGLVRHLRARNTTYAMVSRAPLPKLAAWKAARGWDVPWYSSFGSDFNYDFGVTIDDRVGPAEYNYRTREEYEARGESFFPAGEASEAPGRSCFLQDGGRVYHTYSTYARGLDGGAYYVLDLTPLGRQDDAGERVR